MLRAAIVVSTTVACARPSLPALSPGAFSFPIDTLRSQRVRDGVNHHYIYSRTGPWAIQVLDVRLDKCVAPMAVKGEPKAEGRIKTSVILHDLARTQDVVGGVNADFFSLQTGVPQGGFMSNGQQLTPPSGRPMFTVDSSGVPRIATSFSRTRDAVGGRPVLATDSVAAALTDTAAFTASRHPRTAVGIASNGTRLLLVTVDGRQKPYSDGMTLPELARLMLALGARDALNLDGGGSTTFVYADPDSSRACR